MYIQIQEKMLLEISSSGGMEVLVETRTGINYQSAGAWSTFGTYTLSGWSGWNDIPLVLGTLGGGTTQTGNNWQLRLTFIMTSKNLDYPKNAQVNKLRIYGENAWTTPSTMAATNDLYSFDMSQNATFPGAISGTTFNVGTGSNTWTIDDTTANVLTFKDGANTRLEIKAGGLYVNGSTTALGSGTVTSVGATSPIASSGGSSPTISVASGYTIPTSTEKGQYDTAYTGVNTATNANTASTIVKRDTSGNFSAGTITASLTGTASGNLTSSSTLTAGKLSGTIPSAVLGNSTHYIGTTAVKLNRPSATLDLTGVTNTNWDSAYTATNSATSANTASTIVKRGTSGEFSRSNLWNCTQCRNRL